MLNQRGSGLYYVVNNTGNGDIPDINSIVTVAYKGTLTDGTIFDQSGTSGATFPLSVLYRVGRRNTTI